MQHPSVLTPLLADCIPAKTPSDEPPTVPEVGQLVVDTRHEFLGYSVHQSYCRVRVYTRGEHVICVISEQPDNPGTSVTQCIGQICSEMLPDLVSADPSRRDAITWIEHYSEEPESFDVVTFAVFVDANPRIPTREKLGSFRNPTWRRIERAELESLIGMRWE